MAIPSGELFFIGTATTLISFGPFRILTDPNFLHAGQQVHVGYGLHSTRQTDPAVDLQDLPTPDLVLLSHFHEDHFDREVQERLDHSLPIVTTRQAATALQGLGFRDARWLETWQTWSFRKQDVRLRITALPAQPTPLRAMQPFLPTVMGSLVEFSAVDEPRGPYMRIYISGDTLIHDALRDIPRRFPDIDLGVLHLGGTRIFGVLLTMDGRQGVEALRIVDPQQAVPIHFDDYDVFRSPLVDFRRAVERAGLSHKVRYVARGDRVPLQARVSVPGRPV